ncbi:restriction endonuclease subunit S [Aquidulcibacter sp.]|uniref:restriction endonuclease subunit S n=1 Tax=Aquidulcibacter sp. TaxID=2052990 RepID=UPI0028A6DE79|nr:restriction endonuclease subunit S [Aquidulcibacter sp.]
MAVSSDALPKGFASPSSFIRLGEIARIEKGQTGIMKAEPGPYPLVVTAEARGSCEHFDFEGSAAIVPLVSSAGHGKASLQRLHYQEGKFALGSILAAIFPYAPDLVSARFIFEYLTAFKNELLVSQMIGTANVSLSVGKVSDVPVPLVPPVVQRKIDELMALCDQLEAARAEREASRDRLAVASLARLNSPDPETFEEDARFALNALPALTTRPDQIKALRQTILNLAVRGKLVPQDPNDEPASELLKRIAKEKARLDRKERTKREPRTQTEEAEPTRLPKGWALAPLAELVSILNGRAYKQSELLSAGTPVLRVGNLFTSDRWYYSTLQLDNDKYCDKGDLIFAWSASFGPFIWTGEKVIYHYHIWKLPLHSEANLSKLYLYNFLLQKTREIKEAGHGISMIHMTKEKMELIQVPLPPLAEQDRIVAKVDELMALCDQLEASLTNATSTRSRLLNALLAEALRPVETHELEAVE